jgi:hypothetical protein
MLFSMSNRPPPIEFEVRRDRFRINFVAAFCSFEKSGDLHTVGIQCAELRLRHSAIEEKAGFGSAEPRLKGKLDVLFSGSGSGRPQMVGKR